MDLSIPYSAECLTFLTPQAFTDNSWQTLILPFSKEMWAGVLFLLFCVGFVFYVLGQIHLILRRKEILLLQKTTNPPINAVSTGRRYKLVKQSNRIPKKNESNAVTIKIIPKEVQKSKMEKTD